MEAAVQIELEALKRRLYIDNQVRNIKFFPGSDLEASPEDFAREINKFFADAENEISPVDMTLELDGPQA